MNYSINIISNYLNCDYKKSKIDIDITIKSVSIDSRDILLSKNHLFFSLISNRNGHDFIENAYLNGVRNFVVMQDVDVKSDCNYFYVKDTLISLQLLARNHRLNFNIPIIVIGGSKGKTTVKEWLFEILSKKYTVCKSPKSYNSQIGVALSVLNLENDDEIGIFELSISKFGEMQILLDITTPTHSIITNIDLNDIQSFNTIVTKKNEYFLLKKINNYIENFNYTSFDYIFDDKINIENCNSVINILKSLNYKDSEIQSEIINLQSIALRLELHDGIHNSKILNDSYTIDKESFISTLDFFIEQSKNNKRILILSDILKLSIEDYNEILKNVEFEKLFIISDNIEYFSINKYFKNATHFKTISDFIENIGDYDFEKRYILIKGMRKYRFEKILSHIQFHKHQTICEIDFKTIRKNFYYYKNLLPKDTGIIVMLKAFGYGAGDFELANYLDKYDISYFGVAKAEEGVKLKLKGIKTNILVLNPERESFYDIIKYNLEPEIYNFYILDHFIKALINNNIKYFPIHIKVNTGMNRLGFNIDDINKLIQIIKSQSEIIIKSVFSHLSTAEIDKENEFTLNQIEKFNKIKTIFDNKIDNKIDYHILNSAGIEKFNSYNYDMARLGIGLFIGNNQNAISLKTSIIEIKNLNKGEYLGYSKSYFADKFTKIAILPIGYADGFLRILGNGKFEVYINGNYYPTIANVCMDMCFVDISKSNDLSIGEEVEIFGINNSIEKISKAMNTIPYEVLTLLSNRVKRVYYK